MLALKKNQYTYLKKSFIRIFRLRTVCKINVQGQSRIVKDLYSFYLLKKLVNIFINLKLLNLYLKNSLKSGIYVSCFYSVKNWTDVLLFFFLCVVRISDYSHFYLRRVIYIKKWPQQPRVRLSKRYLKRIDWLIIFCIQQSIPTC